MYVIQSNFGTPGNYEAVRCEGSRLVHYWRDNVDQLSRISYWKNFPDTGDPSQQIRDGYLVCPWYRGVEFGANANSQPALLQGRFGNKGNFELLVREGNSLRYYWRDNDAADLAWHTGALFGANVNSAPAMLESTLGTSPNRSNFCVVVREGNNLRYYWRDNDSPGLTWHTGALFADGVSSAPAMIQSSTVGQPWGNFEVVVREGDKLRHYWRDNNAPNLPWYTGALFGGGATGDPALVEVPVSSSQRDLLVVVRCGDELQSYRCSGSNGQWARDNTPYTIIFIGGDLAYPPVTAEPTLLRSTFNRLNEYELFTQIGSEFAHFTFINYWNPITSGPLPASLWTREILAHASVPNGNPPGQAQIDKFRASLFLNLRNWSITDQATQAYNCIAWSLGLTAGWLWPDPYPWDGSLDSQIAAFDQFYATYGWTRCTTGYREYRKRKIALYAGGRSYGSGLGVSHASRESDTGNWHESKCGGFERIVHDRFQMQGQFSAVDTSQVCLPTYYSYGDIVAYYEKADSSANLDLVRISTRGSLVKKGSARNQFEDLYGRWREDIKRSGTLFSSNPYDYTRRESYRRIIGLGEAALPLILEQIDKGDFLLNRAALEIGKVSIKELVERESAKPALKRAASFRAAIPRCLTEQEKSRLILASLQRGGARKPG